MFFLISFTLFLLNAQADDLSTLTKELKLYAGTKASIQWERVFSSKRRMKQYALDTLNEETKYKLKNYLINHAADSEQPIVPGL